MMRIRSAPQRCHNIEVQKLLRQYVEVRLEIAQRVPTIAELPTGNRALKGNSGNALAASNGGATKFNDCHGTVYPDA